MKWKAHSVFHNFSPFIVHSLDKLRVILFRFICRKCYTLLSACIRKRHEFEERIAPTSYIMARKRSMSPQKQPGDDEQRKRVKVDTPQHQTKWSTHQCQKKRQLRPFVIFYCHVFTKIKLSTTNTSVNISIIKTYACICKILNITYLFMNMMNDKWYTWHSYYICFRVYWWQKTKGWYFKDAHI